MGDRKEPCSTPACISLGLDISPSTETLNFLWERKELISLIRLIENVNLDNLYSKPKCQVVANAFLISENTAAVDMLLLKFKVAWSVSLINWSVVLWQAQKPKRLALIRPLSSVCPWTIFRMTPSNFLSVVDKRLIRRKLWRNFGSLPGFGKVINFVSFQGFGKLDSRRQWLNKRARYTSGFLEDA
jgi:hypothetical protein